MRLTEKRVGLLINFNSRLLKDGIKRVLCDRASHDAAKRRDGWNDR